MGTTTTSYVYDVSTSLPDVLTDGTLKYVYGLGLTYAVDSSGNVQVNHTDGLGSARAITDANGNVVETYQTDEFGVPTQSQGTSSQPFQFTGQQSDSESGLYFLRAHYYDPATGRLLSRDPQFGNLLSPATLNGYVYVRNNPPLFEDPSGRFAIEQAQVVGAAEDLSCENLTHEMAVELLNGNAQEIGWKDPSVLTNGRPIDITLFVLVTVGTDGEAEGAETLSRLGTSYESASRLARKANEAESAIGIHGVSVTAGEPRGQASSAHRPMGLQTRLLLVVCVSGSPYPHRTRRRTTRSCQSSVRA